MGGTGKTSPGGGGVVRVNNTRVNVPQQMRALGIPNMTTARQVAKYLQLKDGSLEKKVMDDLIKHGGRTGMGGLGAIRLRMGLPRDKLLDLKNVFKSLHDHGMIALTGLVGRVNVSQISDEQQADTLVTLSYIKRMKNGASSDVIAALAGADNQRRNQG